jgi:hypothetical protein
LTYKIFRGQYQITKQTETYQKTTINGRSKPTTLLPCFACSFVIPLHEGFSLKLITMKKQVFSIVLFAALLLFSANIFAQYPISSYDKPVESGSYFAESHSYAPVFSSEKRKLNIDTTDPSTSFEDSEVIFIAFSLDFQEFRGPFTLDVGSSKQIDIDDREWGVYVLFVKGRSLMSVSTEEESTGN